ncbi:hypothetical protein GCK32_014413, partial [Trichostrongylus colubriformis]
ELEPLPGGKYHIVRRVMETDKPHNIPPEQIEYGGSPSYPSESQSSSHPAWDHQPSHSGSEHHGHPGHPGSSQPGHPGHSGSPYPGHPGHPGHPGSQHPGHPSSQHPGHSGHPGSQDSGHPGHPVSQHPGHPGHPGSQHPGHPGSQYPGHPGHPGSSHPARDEPPSSAHFPDRGEPPALAQSDRRAPSGYPAPQPHPQQYGGGDRETLPPIQYDETWYEPPGQGSYPRLLFSPHHGWREMSEDEVRRVRRIQPLADYDPELSSPVDNLPDQESRNQKGSDSTDPRHHRPYPHSHQMQRPSDMHQSSHQTYPSAGSHGQYPDHAHEQRVSGHAGTTSESSEEENPIVERRTDVHGRTWILQDGRWHPADGSEPMPQQTQTPPTVIHADRGGVWVYRDGLWQRDPNAVPGAAAQVPQTQPHENREGPQAEPYRPPDGWVSRNGKWDYEGQTPAGRQDEARDSAPQESDVRAGNGWVLRDGIWYYEPQGQTEAPTTPPQTGAERAGDGWVLRDGTWYYEPQNYHDQRVHARIHGAADHAGAGQWEFHDGAWHFVKHGQPYGHAPGGNVEGHMVHADPDHDRMVKVKKVHVPDHGDHSQKLVQRVVKLESGGTGDDEGASKDNDSSIDYRESEGSQRIPQASTDGGFAPHGPPILTVDDFKRLQPPLTGTESLQDGAANLSCDGMNMKEEPEEFWLLRTTPCGENAPEGRILMPNGEIVKFYGYPKLVQA